jgi:hypothetical protein
LNKPAYIIKGGKSIMIKPTFRNFISIVLFYVSFNLLCLTLIIAIMNPFQGANYQFSLAASITGNGLIVPIIIWSLIAITSLIAVYLDSKANQH